MVRRKRQQRRRRAVRVGRSIRRSIIGFFPRGRQDPPPIVSAPWNSVIVSVHFTSTTAGWNYTALSSLRTTVKAQLGLPSAHAIQMRLRRVDVWNRWAVASISATLLDKGLACRFLDPTDTCTPTLASKEDEGTAVTQPHVHYIWPTHISSFSLCNTNTNNYLGIDVQSNFSGLLHVHVLWRSEQFDPIPSVQAMVTATRPMRVSSPTLTSEFDACDLNTCV